jgi:NAD(P)-dependent dehydrogenase (short-subunit alcohol dehydrogenase family)
MIGCLGGLGRSLAKWMMERGAKRFVFLGRSGLDKAPARRLVEDLTHLGATCEVVRGDVCSIRDVELMVGSADGPIGGVVQAAMGLNVSVFVIISV